MGKAYIRVPFQSMFWCSPWWCMPQPSPYMEQKLPDFRLHLVLAFQDSNLKSHQRLWILQRHYKQQSRWRATEGEAEPWLRERSRHDLARWLFWPEITERCFCQQATTWCIFKTFHAVCTWPFLVRGLAGWILTGLKPAQIMKHNLQCLDISG